MLARVGVVKQFLSVFILAFYFRASPSNTYTHHCKAVDIQGHVLSHGIE